MDQAKALAAFDRERQALETNGFRRIAEDNVIRHVPITGGARRAGFVSYSRHSALEVDAAIDAVMAAYAALDCEFEWKAFEHDMPGDLVARLAKRGLRIGAAEDLLLIEVAAAEALLRSQSEHRIERVVDRSGLSDYLSVAIAVWPDKQDYPAWLEQELRTNPDEIAIYVAYVGGKAVASARSSFPHGSRFAGLWTGSTLPEYRGRGLYAALVAARAREAALRGYEYLMVDALPTSQPILKRMGFERVSASYPCCWPST